MRQEKEYITFDEAYAQMRAFYAMYAEELFSGPDPDAVEAEGA